jgi:hypothetical protein
MNFSTNTQAEKQSPSYVVKLMGLLFLLAVMPAISGCAGTPSFGVTYDSFPRGATLLCSGSNFGYTPVTLFYELEKIKGQTYINSNCSANWASGAKSNYDAIPWQNFGSGVTTTAARPNTPGIEKDMEFALKVEQAQAQQLQQDSGWPSTAVVNCTKMGDLSGRVYQFKNFCPVGFFAIN